MIIKKGCFKKKETSRYVSSLVLTVLTAILNLLPSFFSSYIFRLATWTLVCLEIIQTYHPDLLFLIIIFQIQTTDIIKTTTQKQGGLADDSRAIAVVSIFTKINISVVLKQY